MVEPSQSRSIRVVFDCNVLVQAMANFNGPAGSCFQAVREGRVTLCMGRALIAEFMDIVTRPLLINKLRLTDQGTSNFLAEVRALSLLIEPVPAVFRHPIDPKDSMIVDLAVAAGAHVITSRDRHLLLLRDVSTPAGADFMARFGFIDVLTPVELLERLKIKKSGGSP